MILMSRSEAQKIGAKRYFTAEPCIRSHVSERLTSNGTCLECVRIKSYQYFLKNKKTHPRTAAKNNNQKYYFTGKACKNGHVNQRRVSDAKCRICARIKTSLRNKNNVLYIRAHVKNAKLKRKKVKGKFADKDIKKILNSQKFKCVNCKSDIRFKYHIDHIMPLSLGGTNWPNNLQCLCPSCNLQKSSKDPIQWAQENGRLI